MFELLGNSINESVVALTPEEDAFMESFTDAECKYDDAEEAFLYLAMENEQNFNAILNAVAVQEMSYYVEHGEEMVYEAVDFKGFFETIKKAVLKAWEKIKAVFAKIFDTIEGWIRSDKKFLEKYEADIKKANGVEINFNGYDLDLSYDPIDEIASVVAEFEYAKVLKRAEDKEDIVNRVFKGIGSGVTDKASLVTHMKKKFGLDNKVTIKKFDAATTIENIKTARDSKKTAKAEYDVAKKTFKLMASECDAAAKFAIQEKGLTGDKEKSMNKAAGQFSKAMNTCISLTHTALNVAIKAIKVSNSQAKAMAQKAIQVKANGGKKSTNESAVIGGIEVNLI